jgi:paraquat-inducible protein B
MSKQASPALIGTFVVGAVALLVVGILIFGSGLLSTDKRKLIVYFQGSVNGLNVGAPVKVKGVAVGRVTDILVQYDMDVNRVQTPVIIEVDESRILGTRAKDDSPRALRIKSLIDRGLRAQLLLQSLVTGQLYVDLNFFPHTPMRLVGKHDVMGLHEIPSVPSPTEQLENTFDEVISELRKMPLQETFQKLLLAVQHLERILGSPELSQSLTALNQTLMETHKLVHHFDSKIDPLSADLKATLKDTRTLMQSTYREMTPLLKSAQQALKEAAAAMNQARSALVGVESFTDQDAVLDSALGELSAAARSVRSLTDYLQRNPDVLIYGKPGPAD